MVVSGSQITQTLFILLALIGSTSLQETNEPVICNSNSNIPCYCHADTSKRYWKGAVPPCTDLVSPGEVVNTVQVVVTGCYLDFTPSSESNGEMELRQAISEWVLQECATSEKCDQLKGFSHAINGENVILLNWDCRAAQPNRNTTGPISVLDSTTHSLINILLIINKTADPDCILSNANILRPDIFGRILQTRLHILEMTLGGSVLILRQAAVQSTINTKQNISVHSWLETPIFIVLALLICYIILVWIISCLLCLRDRRRRRHNRLEKGEPILDDSPEERVHLVIKNEDIIKNEANCSPALPPPFATPTELKNIVEEDTEDTEDQDQSIYDNVTPTVT